MNSLKPIVLACSLAVCSAAAIFADSPAEMLEKAIYNEDTIGNLDEAIKIYRKVVAAAGETEALAAKAQYRLGQCLLKQGKKVEATKAFKAIASKYPNQKEMIEKAKQHLPDKLELNPAPWKSGERLTLTMRLGGGQVIGLVGLGVSQGKLEGRDIWDMNVRRFVNSGVNEGVSRVWAERETNRPLKTDFDHTVLGKSESTWTDKKLSVVTYNSGEKDTSEVDLDGEPAFSNDQVMFVLRQLPLKVGYEVTIPIRVAFTGGNALGLEVSVPKMEKIETPVGTYDCFRIETNISQTFFVANIPERYLVQFNAEGVVAKLSSVSHKEKPTPFKNEKLGFSCTVPAGWFHIALPSNNDEASGGIHMVAPEMASATVYAKDKELLDKEDREALNVRMKSKIRRCERTYKDFLVRKAPYASKVGPLEALSMLADYQAASRDYVLGLTLTLTDTMGVQVNESAVKSQYDGLQKQFESIRTSFQPR